MLFFYGKKNRYINVTNIILNNCLFENKIKIPKNDLTRLKLFKKDPIKNVVKEVIFINNNKRYYFDAEKEAIIDLISIDNYDKELYNKEIEIKKNTNKYLEKLHSELQLVYGKFSLELPEQKLAITYIEKDDIVLELGGNCGRNSLIISSILSDQSNLLVLECDEKSVAKLKKNREVNNLNFQIEPSALSEHNLVLIKWTTYISDTILPNSKKVNTIKYPELIEKYKLKFNTLVIDCEGAFYFILKSYPVILKNIKKIIIENDFKNIKHKIYVLNFLKKNKFNLIHELRGKNTSDFYQVWMKL